MERAGGEGVLIVPFPAWTVVVLVGYLDGRGGEEDEAPDVVAEFGGEEGEEAWTGCSVLGLRRCHGLESGSGASLV